MKDLNIRELKLLLNLLADSALNVNDILLKMCADFEYRICMLELGLNGDTEI